MAWYETGPETDLYDVIWTFPQGSWYGSELRLPFLFRFFPCADDLRSQRLFRLALHAAERLRYCLLGLDAYAQAEERSPLR